MEFMELNDYEISNSLNETSTHFELAENNEFGTSYINRLKAHVEWLESVNQDLSYKVQEAQWKAQQLEYHLNKILTSVTWRITTPLRSKFIQNPVLTYWNKIKRCIKLVLIHLTSYIQQNPRFKRPLLRAIDCFPRMKLKLITVITSGSEPNLEQPLTPATEQPLTTIEQPLTVPIAQPQYPINRLGHRAKHIYEQLMAANQHYDNKNK